MENKKTHSSLKFLIFVTSLIVVASIYYDITQEGSWKNSNAKRILTNFEETVINKIKHGLLLIDDHFKQNFPSYHNATVEFSRPYIKLLQNIGCLSYNAYIDIEEAALEHYPLMLQSIESYAPGLVQQSQNTVHNIWSSSIFYLNKSVDYLQTEVFVSQLSIENLQNVVFQMLNTTQCKASEYYHWLYKKVQSGIN